MLLFLWSNTFHFSGRLPAKKIVCKVQCKEYVSSSMLFFVFLNVNESYHKKVETQISVGRHARQVLIIYVDNIEQYNTWSARQKCNTWPWKVFTIFLTSKTSIFQTRCPKQQYWNVEAPILVQTMIANSNFSHVRLAFPQARNV